MIECFQILVSNSTCAASKRALAGAFSRWQEFAEESAELKAKLQHAMVGQCRLTVSKAVLKARLVSALETQMW
jgi:hypothetical protein